MSAELPQQIKNFVFSATTAAGDREKVEISIPEVSKGL